MSKSFTNYEWFYTKSFEKQLKKIGDGRRIKRINDTADKIVADPYHNIEFGKGRYRGKREYYAWNGDRLIFTVCEQCRELGHNEISQCANCETTPDNMIMFWEIIEGHKY